MLIFSRDDKRICELVLLRLKLIVIFPNLQTVELGATRSILMKLNYDGSNQAALPNGVSPNIAIGF